MDFFLPPLYRGNLLRIAPNSSIMRYHHFSILLHWLMVILIAVLFVWGWYMTDLPEGSTQRSFFFRVHKSLGLTAALLLVIRLGWRLFTPPPALPDTLSLFQTRAAHLTHNALYLLLLLQPLSGYLSSSFSGYKTRFWGIPLPHWGWKSPPLNELFTDIHNTLSVVLLILIVVHVGAIILHAWQGQGVMGRMLPWGKETRYTPPG